MPLFAYGVQRHRDKQHTKRCGYGERDISTPWYGARRGVRAHTRRHKSEERYVIRRDAATNEVPTSHDNRTEPPKAYIPPPFLCLTGRNERERRAGEEKDSDTHQGGGREKVHAREKGGQRKG